MDNNSYHYINMDQHREEIWRGFKKISIYKINLNLKIVIS